MSQCADHSYAGSAVDAVHSIVPVAMDSVPSSCKECLWCVQASQPTRMTLRPSGQQAAANGSWAAGPPAVDGDADLARAIAASLADAGEPTTVLSWSQRSLCGGAS